MKTHKDPRHLKRIQIIQELFSWGFNKQSLLLRNKKSKKSGKIQPIISSIRKIDKLIAKSAPDRPIEQINRVDLSILRLAVYELVVEKNAPPKVIIDEAVELGKQFGSDSSPAFINGALGKLLEIKGIKT